MANRLTTRMSDLGDRAKDRMTENRLDKLDRENDRLKHEVRLLRDDLQEERSALQRALDALSRDEHVTVETKAPKRRGRLLSLVAIGGAYLLGAKAGRERYDQVVDKAKSLKSSVAGRNGHGADEPWVPNEAPSTTTSPAREPGTTANGS
jgi:DNA-binding MarR family transcriptional regulator